MYLTRRKSQNQSTFEHQLNYGTVGEGEYVYQVESKG